MPSNANESAIDFEQLENDREAIKQRFQNGRPFKYLVIDEFCLPEIAETLSDQFPERGKNWIDASGKHAKRKWTAPVPPGTHAEIYFDDAKSPRFLRFLEYITGIDNIICDDDYFGAGFHQTYDGGFLDVHVDFNKLPNGLDRRLNVLVYMNKNWLPGWGGELELWDMERKERIANVEPILNRAVIFETNEVSFHGQSNPVNTGGVTSRKSFSTYYYTEGRPDEEMAAPHSTIYVNTEGKRGAVKVALNVINQILTLKPLRRRLAEKGKKGR